MPVTNYYCSVEHKHRLTPCIHERCKKMDYTKMGWSSWSRRISALMHKRVNPEDGGDGA